MFWSINIVALTIVPNALKLCCQTSTEVERELFQYPFTPEALIVAGTFIPTFALPFITALTWHFGVMVTELLCVKQAACSLSWSHGRLGVLRLNTLAVWSQLFTQKVRLLATNLPADVSAAASQAPWPDEWVRLRVLAFIISRKQGQISPQRKSLLRLFIKFHPAAFDLILSSPNQWIKAKVCEVFPVKIKLALLDRCCQAHLGRNVTRGGATHASKMNGKMWLDDTNPEFDS